VLPPAGVDSGIFVKELKGRFGAVITNGQGEMKGQIFRIAHLGLFDYMDTIALIGALEQIAVDPLKLPGFEFGKALIAAQKVYASRPAFEAQTRECGCGRATCCRTAVAAKA
jgi:aspartate aminotransferase-like enzyme